MNKKQLFLIAAVLSPFLFSSCKKASADACTYTESTLVAPASEVATLQAYLAASGHPLAIQHPSGIFYEITTQGTGASPAICSNLLVKYSGYLLNGTKFDENLTGASFVLGQLIVGWQKGLPLLKKGGTMNLYVPPSLGYGANTVGVIPGNSNLIFVIQLIDVQ